MRKKLFFVSLVLAFLALPAMADDAVAALQPSDEQQAAPAADVAAADSESCAAAPEAALDPLFAEPFQAFDLAAGEFCGGVFCGKFEYCCNPSCALCVPFGMSCTQQSCN
jgi:hypothetical protein